MASGAALTPALMTLRVMGTIRAYVSAKHCGLSLVLSKEIRTNKIGSCVDRTMGISAGAGPGTGWRMLPQLGQGARVPEGPGQRLASDHRRPLEAESGKIVRGSTHPLLGWPVQRIAGQPPNDHELLEGSNAVDERIELRISNKAEALDGLAREIARHR